MWTTPVFQWLLAWDCQGLSEEQDRYFLDCNTVTFYNSREGWGLVPFDWARKDWLVLAGHGWNDGGQCSRIYFQVGNTT